MRATAAVGALACGGTAGIAWSIPESMVTLTAVDAVSAMRRGALTAEAYARALLDHAESLQSLNAFITLDRELVLAAAREADRRRAAGATLGVLHGLPLPIKDSINTKSLPTSSGTRSLRAFKAHDDAPVIGSLLSAGALPMGKTNLHELSYGWTCNNGFTGPVRNPYDTKRIPGGSSGGSGVAVAARCAPLAVAEDTFGSIRVPASMCGVCGLRPSTGRYPSGGVMPISPRMDAVGPLARTVADLALFDTAITGQQGPSVPAQSLRGVRIGVAAQYFLTGLDPAVEAVMSATLRRLAAAGAVIVWAELPEAATTAMGDGLVVQAEDTVPSIEQYLVEHRTGVTFDQLHAQLSPDVKGIFDSWTLPSAANHPSRETIDAAIARLPVIRKAMETYFSQHELDVIAFPPVPLPAMPIGQDAEVEIVGQKQPIWAAMSHNIAVGSCAGMPGLVLPGGLTKEGLPVGIEFDALPGQDRRLLDLGLQIEKVLGTIPAPKLEV